MELFKNSTAFDDTSDESLVAACLEGDRDAFGKIVLRYQRLLCSLAYSSLGDLAASEDVAQEAFVEAWKKLGSLKEPGKLKAWLCGILRFKLSHHRRKEARQPARNAEELDEALMMQSAEEATEETTMRDEEKALLWQALEKVPETYRDTLVLYYREHRSVEHVAYELELSEDAVKQRLSRGRKLLQEKMMHFVEDALAKSAPRSVFTIGVLSALATVTPPAKAATVGVAAAQAGVWFKWVSVAAFAATFSGLVSSFFALRASLDQSRTKRERQHAVRIVLLFFGVAAIFTGGMFGLRYWAVHSYEYAGYITVGAQGLVLAFALSYIWLTVKATSGTQQLREAERKRRPDLFLEAQDRPESARREYRSPWTFFGIPLLHFKLATAEAGEGPAFGWIAGGAKAYGVLFAWGGYAVAPISVGIVAVGLVSVGALGFGVVGLGTLGIGFLAVGASAIGYKAYGSLSATGWESAFSPGFSIANEGAMGSIAYAAQVNNDAAGEIVNLTRMGEWHGFVLAAMALLVIVPVVLYAKAVRKRMRKGR